jgi:predicted nucleic acid-binding protein
MTRGLLDTSVVIAIGAGTVLALPDEAVISTMTLCELHAGVLLADDQQRPQRLATLAMVERLLRPLAMDHRVATHFGRIVAVARRSGRRPGVADALIAATAAAHGVPVYTRDRDFTAFDGVEVVCV